MSKDVRAEFPRVRQRALQAAGDACLHYLPLAIARGARTGFDLDWARLPLANLSFVQARGYHPRWECLSQSLTSELTLEFVFPYERGGDWEARACWVFSALRPAQVDLRWRYLLAMAASGVLGDALCVLITDTTCYAFGYRKLHRFDYDADTGLLVIYGACGRSVCIPASEAQASMLERWHARGRVRLVDWTVASRRENALTAEESGHEGAVSETGSCERSPVAGTVGVPSLSDTSARDGASEPVACGAGSGANGAGAL